MALPRSLALRRLQQHEARFGARQVDLAAHAALPVVLDPRLMHLLRINFFLDADDPLPWTAETDLLFSPICTDLGDGLYEIEPTTRTLLLERLASKPHGDRRIGEVASLLWAYLHGRPAPWAHEPGIERAQELTALQLLDPAECERWLARAEAAVSRDAVAERPWFVAMRRKLAPTEAVVARKKEGWRWNGTRVLVIGTGRQLSPEEQWMSRALGAALARAGFGLVSGGWWGVDHEVTDSYVTAAREIDGTGGYLEVVMIDGQTASLPGSPVTYVGEVEHMDASLERADAVVVIGGRKWTMRAFKRALALGKRVFPIAGTGGSAKEALDRLRKESEPDTELLDALDGPIRAAGRAALLAERLIELLQRPERGTQQVDVAIFVRTPEELEAVLREKLPWGGKNLVPSPDGLVAHSALTAHGLRLLVAMPTRMGLPGAPSMLRIIHAFRPRLVIETGLAFAVGEVGSGDLAMASRIIGGTSLERVSRPCDAALIAEMRQHLREGWAPDVPLPDGRGLNRPVAHVGAILFTSPAFQLPYTGGDLVAVDMADGAAMIIEEATASYRLAVVKGLSGFADRAEKQDRWRTYSLQVAASFVVSFVERLGPDLKLVPTPPPPPGPPAPFFSKGLDARYARRLHEELGFLPTWPFDARLAVGEVATLHDGLFRRVTSLAELGIAATPRQEEPHSLEVASGASVRIARGQASAMDRLVVELEGSGAFLFEAFHARTESLDTAALEPEILRLVDQKRWELGWVVIDTLVSARLASLLLASSAKASISFRTARGEPMQNAGILASGMDLEVFDSTHAVSQLLNVRDCTPLFKASRVQRTWGIGARRLVSVKP